MSVKKAAIINLNSGNLLSIVAAVKKAGFDTTVINQPEDGFDALVMPGQGRFGYVASQLDQNGWRPFIQQWVAEDKKFLGICVGMQLLFDGSVEDQSATGLGIMPGTVTKLNHPKTPMVGWAKLTSEQSLFNDDYVYFVNSYGLAKSDHCVASVNYGQAFCAAVNKGQVYGFQFHPEKSGQYGLEMLKQCLN